MNLEQLVHRFEANIFELLRGESPTREEKLDPITLLRGEIAQQQARLDLATTHRGELAQRIEQNAQAAALLPSQIECSVRRGKSSQAIRQALELDRLRRDLDTDRADLSRLDQAIWSLSFRLRQLARQLRQLQKDRPRQP